MLSNHINNTEDNMNNESATTETVVSKNIIEKLKIKWGLESVFQVIIVLLVFSITGSTVVYLRKFLFSVLGFDESTAMWLKTITYIVFVFPAYQFLILGYGALLGQFDFFWKKEKKLFYAVKRLFTKK